MNQLRGRILRLDRDLKRVIWDYFISVLVINYLVLSLLVISGRNTDNIVLNLNQYGIFAWKYLTCAIVIAVVVPFVENFLSNQIKLSVSISKHRTITGYCTAAIIIYLIVLFVINYVRIFDNNFWMDECYTILNTNGTFIETVKRAVTKDVHPPLYYLIFHLMRNAVGSNGTVYHFVSLIPLVVMLIVTLTVVRKEFGNSACIIFAAFASLLPNALKYNVEVRMYSWAALFVFLSFLSLYMILIKERRRDYIFFTIFSVLAAYTHYYALLSAAWFYVALFLLAIYKRKKWSRIIAVYGCTVILYIPWLSVLLNSFQKSSGEFWIQELPTIQECIYYIFNTRYGYVLLGVLFFTFFIIIVTQTGIISLHNTGDNKTSINVCFDEVHLPFFCVWIITGAVSIFGTLAVAVIVSTITRPLLILRYIYPVTVLAWLIFAACVSKLKYSSFLSAVILAVTLVSVWPEYKGIYSFEKYDAALLETTLEATQEQISTGDMILTNTVHVDDQVSEYYYPEVEHQLITLDKFPELEDNVQYWLMIDQSISEELVIYLKEHFYSAQPIVEQGSLGTVSVWIYKLESGINNI